MTCSFWLVFPLTVWQNFNVLPWCCFWRLVPNFRPIPVTKNSLSPFHHKRSPQSGVFSSLPCASMTLNLNASWVWGFFDRFSHPTSKFFDSDLPVSSPCSTQKIILPEDHSLLLQQNPQTRFSEKFSKLIKLQLRRSSRVCHLSSLNLLPRHRLALRKAHLHVSLSRLCSYRQVRPSWIGLWTKN